jgi:MerR family transcriptional regulator, copper efflux regulator
MSAPLLTVGRLARRVGLRPSALRYYEEQGLLQPTDHSSGGYRLYDAAAEETLRFIMRAQRLGFTLADIRTLLAARSTGGGDAALIALAETRYIALERQLTPLLIARHELAHLLQELEGASATVPNMQISQLIHRICGDPLHQPAETTLDRLLTLTGCELTSHEGQALLIDLRGVHTHIWLEGETYNILVVGANSHVGAALERLAQLEATCAVHGATSTREVRRTAEGYLFSAQGEAAFLYARLFLALEKG